LKKPSRVSAGKVERIVVMFGYKELKTVNPMTQFIANNIDRYPKLMK
jgi:hypothetical protein